MARGREEAPARLDSLDAVEVGRGSRPDRQVALGGAVLQDAECGHRRGARRARAPERRPREAVQGGQGRRHRRGEDRAAAVDGRRPRHLRQARPGERRCDALRRDARVGRGARAARLPSCGCRARSAPISRAAGRRSRIAAGSRASAVPNAAARPAVSGSSRTAALRRAARRSSRRRHSRRRRRSRRARSG